VSHRPSIGNQMIESTASDLHCLSSCSLLQSDMGKVDIPMEMITHLKRIVVTDIPLHDMNVRPSRPLLRYFSLSGRLVPNEADDSIIGIAGQLVQELPLYLISVSIYRSYLTYIYIVSQVYSHQCLLRLQ
jgi:hypothetical protein